MKVVRQLNGQDEDDVESEEELDAIASKSEIDMEDEGDDMSELVESVTPQEEQYKSSLE